MKKNKYKVLFLKSNTAITLISLVITIIVLLILAGITLTFVLGENGLFGKARKAKEDTNKAQAIEDVQLKIAEAQTEGLGDLTWENFLNVLKNAKDTYLVKTESSQTSALSSDNDGITDVTALNNHTTGSVYVTNLTNYKYEVEIGSDFKIKNSISSSYNSGSTTSGSGGGSQSGGGTTSNIINSFSIKESGLSSTWVNINIDGTITTTDNSPIVGYIIIINNELRTLSENMPIKLTLQKNTTYTIKVKAIDNKGNTKEANNSLSVTTPNLIITALDYPILTKDGMKNVKCTNPGDETDYYYDLDLNFTCTANDALSNDGFDGDDSTTVSTGVFKIMTETYDIWALCFRSPSNDFNMHFEPNGNMRPGEWQLLEGNEGVCHVACWGHNGYSPYNASISSGSFSEVFYDRNLEQ